MAPNHEIGGAADVLAEQVLLTGGGISSRPRVRMALVMIGVTTELVHRDRCQCLHGVGCMGLCVRSP